eukprot:6472774-Heterocapsa_arctica.AAC.1
MTDHIGEVTNSGDKLEHCYTNQESMSYGHRFNRDRAHFMAGYIMFEDWENMRTKALTSMGTDAYASVQKAKHKGYIVELIMEM